MTNSDPSRPVWQSMCNDEPMSEERLDTTWLEDFASRIGVDPIDVSAIEELLALAGDAARDSGDRRNAPISCFLAGLKLGAAGGQVDASAILRVRPV